MLTPGLMQIAKRVLKKEKRGLGLGRDMIHETKLVKFGGNWYA